MLRKIVSFKKGGTCKWYFWMVNWTVLILTHDMSLDVVS